MFEYKNKIKSYLEKYGNLTLLCECGSVFNLRINRNYVIDIESNFCDIAIFLFNNFKYGIDIDKVPRQGFISIKSEEILLTESFFILKNYALCRECGLKIKYDLSKIIHKLGIMKKNEEEIYVGNICSVVTQNKLSYFEGFSINNYVQDRELWNSLICSKLCSRCWKSCDVQLNSPYCQECYSCILYNISFNPENEKNFNSMKRRFSELYDSAFCLFSSNTRVNVCRICDIEKSVNINYNGNIVNICYKCIYLFMKNI